MAQGGAGRLQQVLQIQELFHGRFSNAEATCLLEKYNWDTYATIAFIFTNDPSEVRNKIGNDAGIVLEDLYLERIKHGVDLAEEWSEVGADRRHISKTTRQFACVPCDKSWWKKVPRRKMVSKCFRCKKKYEALQRADEWGWAEFKCPMPCGNVFGGFCQRITSSPCRPCGQSVFPRKIIPPKARRTPGPRRHVDTHMCDAPDCIARRGGLYPNRRRGRDRAEIANVVPNPNQSDTIQTCVHPRNRDGHFKTVVVAPSTQHVSSGSTIDTCLSQDDLGDLVSVIDGIYTYRERSGPMRTIHEDRSEHSSGDEDGH